MGKGARVFEVDVQGDISCRSKYTLASLVKFRRAPSVGHMRENIPAAVQLLVSARDQGSWTVGS